MNKISCSIFRTPHQESPRIRRQTSLNLPRISPPEAPSLATVHSAQHRWYKLKQKWRISRRINSFAITTIRIENTPAGLHLQTDSRTKRLVFVHLATDPSSDERLRGRYLCSINHQTISNWDLQQVIHHLKQLVVPFTLSFQHPALASPERFILCRLCEAQIKASNLEHHLQYCMMANTSEENAQTYNKELKKVEKAIDTRLQDPMAKASILQEEQYPIYQTLLGIAHNASDSSLGSIRSIELCGELLKELRKCMNDLQEGRRGENTSRVTERSLKYTQRLLDLIDGKRKAIRNIHKSQLQISTVDLRRQEESSKHQHSTITMRSVDLQDLTSPDVSSFQTPAPLERGVSTQSPNEDAAAPFYRSVSLGEYHPLSPKATSSAAATRVNIHDFEIIKPISKGAYGKVYLAKKKTTGDRYAIKVLAKEHVLRKKQMNHIVTERNILANAASPFVVSLYWTFQSKQNLFLVMEYIAGGDLMGLLDNLVSLEESVAKIYAAEIVLALKYLHEQGFVHRDLKPDNLLIGGDGHLKLTDFGLSEEGIGADSDPSASSKPEEQNKYHSDSFQPLVEAPSENKNTGTSDPTPGVHAAGTPDYLSPEIILGKAHGPPVDLWALGVILYEMLIGIPPFNDQTVEAIFRNILELRIEWPDDAENYISRHAIHLILHLLNPNPEERLTCEQVMNHPFFHGINWETLRESTPPFVPQFQDPDDTSYFNNRNLTEMFIEDNIPEDVDVTTLDSWSEEVDEVVNRVDSAASIAGEIDGFTTDAVLERTISPKIGDTRERNDSVLDEATAPTDFQTFSFTNMNALMDVARADADARDASAKASPPPVDIDLYV